MMFGRLLLLLAVSAKVWSQSFSYTETGLPVCYIATADPVASKYEYVGGRLKMVQGDSVLMDDSISIRLRGNATLEFPKKSFKLKFLKKVTPFAGMSHDRAFVLLANYSDKSLLKTSVGMRVGELIDYRWVPRSQFVEVVLNGEFLGNYQFIENVKRDKQRLDIARDGFLVEFDFDWQHSEHYFCTAVNHWYFTPKYPEDDEMVDSLFSYAEATMNAFETALYDTRYATNRRYAELIDEESFAKWYYWKNLMQMDECNRYFLKNNHTDDSRLEMGPLWDFEWCLGVTKSAQRPSTRHYFVNKLYFARIATDPAFMRRVAQLHEHYGPAVRQGVMAHYAAMKDSIARSQQLNFERWPILDVPVSLAIAPAGSWQLEVEWDEQFFLSHYEWLDQQLRRYSTGVDVVAPDEPQNGTLWSLGGQRVDAESLRPGIYIKNGRKVVVR